VCLRLTFSPFPPLDDLANDQAAKICEQEESVAIATIYVPFSLLAVCGVVGCITSCKYLKELGGDSGSNFY
jgi:hypothetical protein